MSKESLDSCPKLILTQINPFSPKEAEIITLIVEGRSYKQIAHILGYSHQGIKNLITAKADFSIFSKVGKITGKRPSTVGEMLAILTGDVLLLEKD